MKKILIIALCFFSVQLTWAQEVELSTTEAANLKAMVQKTASETESITSDFIQKKHLDFLSNDIETFGKMVYKTPNLIKWEYTEPYQYSVVFKEDKLHINDGGIKNDVNLKGNKMFQSLNDLMAKSMKGDMFDESEFKMAFFKKENNYLVRFEPIRKELNTYIKAFELTFAKENGDVLEVKMIEPSDDYTLLIFENKLMNVEVADEVFDY